MRILVLLLVGMMMAAGGWRLAAQPSAAAPAFSFAEPGISPDGREIAFTSGGSIWSAPASGGDARLLVADGATDRRPLFSPDGRELAFVSSRTGGGDIYVLTFATGAVRRLTFDDGLEQLDAWSPDGRWLYFSTSGHDIGSMNDLYRVPASGGTPMPVSEDRYTNEFQAAPAPDGRHVAFAARGNAPAQWWRRSGSHLDRSELWMVDVSGAVTAASYGEITPRDARQEWPMWSRDGRTLFYVSDRGGAENVWSHAIAGGPDRALTAFRDGRVLWPSIAGDGRTMAFERDFGIWVLDASTGQAKPVPIVRRGAAVTPPPERQRLTAGLSGLALSADGKKVAFIARGDVFAASAKDGGDATRVTTTGAIASQPVWAPDSRRLAYAAGGADGQRIMLYDFGTNTETAVTQTEQPPSRTLEQPVSRSLEQPVFRPAAPRGSEDPRVQTPTIDLSPAFSPDGKSLAFLRNRRELHVIDLASRADRTLATGEFGDTIDDPRPAWSPDGRWIAVLAAGTKGFTNVDLVSLDGGPPRPVSALANSFANAIAWSPDGKYVLFDTRQRTEGGRLARIDLTLRTPKFREDLFRDLFQPPARPADAPKPTADPGAPSSPAAVVAAPGPVVPVFDGIRERLSLLPIGLDVVGAVISPDGKTACVVATAGGQANLYAYSLDDLAPERPVARQLTTTAGDKADPQFTPDGKEIYYLDGGRINIVTVDRREARPLAVTAELTVDFAKDRRRVFDQAWALMRDNFFDASFHGVDWNRSRDTYGARVDAAGTPDEMRRLMSLMVGDLDASHLGVTAPGGAAPAVGRLGLRFDRLAYETRGELVVTDVIPLGPAALTRDIRAGDVLVSINGRSAGAGADLDELLLDTIDRRVVLGLRRPAPGPGAGGAATQSVREIVIRPINQATEKSLLYRAWVENNREYVLKASGGRLGYVHMLNMSAAALDQLFVDLDADNHARDGVVIDIRNNTGGFVHAYALDVFTRQPYLRMSTRALPESPARSVLGQRSLEAPTVLVVNQHSLSDAEDFTEGYRTLRLGPVVGEPTAGWIIYTWDVRLIDGTTFRLPRMRVKASDLTDMEGHPRPVDSEVTRPIGESLSPKDSQLDEAIRVLLKKLGKAE